MKTVPNIFAPVRNPPRRRKRRSVASQSPAPPAAVTLTAVHTQPAPSVLMFVFDDDVISIDGVAAEQFECTLDGAPPPGDSIVEFDADSITLQCPVAIEAGMGWRVLTPMDVVWNDDPAIVLSVPASGIVG